MTNQELMAFSVSNDMYLWVGIILGLIFSGITKTVLSILSAHYQRPRRIRFRNLNGRIESKTDFEYLYLFKGEYYTSEQRDFLIKERLKNIKSVSKFDSKFFVFYCVFFVPFTIFMTIAFLKQWGEF